MSTRVEIPATPAAASRRPAAGAKATMRAIRFHEYGGAEVLRYEEAPQPVAGRGEVLVRVHAAGVNPLDWKIRSGLLRERMHHRLPLIPGWDLSGTVETLGEGTRRFSLGDPVFGKADPARDGADAELAAVAESALARKPRSLDWVQAAAIPTAGLTAWQALFEPTALDLMRGQTILVHGASGGVGSFAVQLARWRGARVVGTGRVGNEQLVRSLGADEFVDYEAQRFEQGVSGVDAVLDTVGGDTLRRSFRVLKPGGALVSLVEKPSEEAAREHRVRAALLFSQPSAAQLAEIGRLVDAKVIAPLVFVTYPLEQAWKAHADLESGHARGKIVLRVRA